MFDTLRLEFYNSLTETIGNYPELSFVVEPDDVIDFDISPEMGAADDLFEIYGRNAKFVLSREGEFGDFMASKKANALYPHYLDTIVDVINVNTGELIMRGAVPLEFISYDYNKNLSTITIIDAISIWVREARNTYFEFASEGNYNRSVCIDPTITHPFDFSKLMGDPVQGMGRGLGAVATAVPADIGISSVNDLRIFADGYNDDFRQWQIPHPEANWSWRSYVPQVNYDEDGKCFVVVFVIIVRYGVINDSLSWQYQAKIKSFKLPIGAMLQPVIITDRETSLVVNPAILMAGIGAIWGQENITITGNKYEPIIINNRRYMSKTINYETYAVEIVDIANRTEIHITSPIRMKTVFFKAGRVSYDRILHAMLTINGLTIKRKEGSVQLIKSIVSPDYFDGGAADLSDPIDLTATGTYADINRLTSSVDIVVASDNVKRAISSVYGDTLKRIATKFRFYAPAYLSEWRNYAPFSLVAFFVFGSNTTRKILITQRSYPENGVFLVEGVAEWDR